MSAGRKDRKNPTYNRDGLTYVPPRENNNMNLQCLSEECNANIDGRKLQIHAKVQTLRNRGEVNGMEWE